MSAQEIIDKHMQAARDRANAKKAALTEFVAAYPDVKAWLVDMRSAGFEVTFNAVDFAVHGPIHDRRMWYPATMGAHNDTVKKASKK